MRNCTCPRNFALVAFVPSRRVHVTHTTRNVHSFITLSSRTRNHLTPSEVAISEMTTRSPYVTSVPTLKPPDPPSLSLSLSLVPSPLVGSSDRVSSGRFLVQIKLIFEGQTLFSYEFHIGAREALCDPASNGDVFTCRRLATRDATRLHPGPISKSPLSFHAFFILLYRINSISDTDLYTALFFSREGMLNEVAIRASTGTCFRNPWWL